MGRWLNPVQYSTFRARASPSSFPRSSDSCNYAWRTQSLPGWTHSLGEKKKTPKKPYKIRRQRPIEFLLAPGG